MYHVCAKWEIGASLVVWISQNNEFESLALLPSMYYFMAIASFQLVHSTLLVWLDIGLLTMD